MLFWDAAALKACDAFCQDRLQDLVVVVAAGKPIQCRLAQAFRHVHSCMCPRHLFFRKCPCAHWAFSGMIRRAPGKKSQNFKFSWLSFLVWSASNCIDRLKQVLACPTSAANQGVQNQIKTAHQGVKALVESGVLHLGIALTDSVFPEHKFNSLVVGRGWGEPR